MFKTFKHEWSARKYFIKASNSKLVKSDSQMEYPFLCSGRSGNVSQAEGTWRDEASQIVDPCGVRWRPLEKLLEQSSTSDLRPLQKKKKIKVWKRDGRQSSEPQALCILQEVWVCAWACASATCCYHFQTFGRAHICRSFLKQQKKWQNIKNRFLRKHAFVVYKVKPIFKGVGKSLWSFCTIQLQDRNWSVHDEDIFVKFTLYILHINTVHHHHHHHWKHNNYKVGIILFIMSTLMFWVLHKTLHWAFCPLEARCRVPDVHSSPPQPW